MASSDLCRPSLQTGLSYSAGTAEVTFVLDQHDTRSTEEPDDEQGAAIGSLAPRDFGKRTASAPNLPLLITAPSSPVGTIDWAGSRQGPGSHRRQTEEPACCRGRFPPLGTGLKSSSSLRLVLPGRGSVRGWRLPLSTVPCPSAYGLKSPRAAQPSCLRRCCIQLLLCARREGQGRRAVGGGGVGGVGVGVGSGGVSGGSE